MVAVQIATHKCMFAARIERNPDRITRQQSPEYLVYPGPRSSPYEMDRVRSDPGWNFMFCFYVRVLVLGANCEFAQFINCAAQFVNSQFAQQFINCCANCESYYARSVYELRNES
jgi:hypothetical protein